MRSTQIFSVVLVLGVCLFSGRPAPAQQVTVTTPHHIVGDSFFERMGVHWGLNYKGMNFTFGGPNMAVPPFGNFDPNAGLNSGFHFRRNGLNGFFNWSMGQGYRQSFITQAPSVTLTNGHPGFVSDTSQSPFVISYIPVVGGFPTVGHVNPMMAYPGYSTPSPGNWRVQAMRRQMTGPNKRTAGRPAPARPPKRQPDDDLDLAGSKATAPVARPSGPAEKLNAAQSSSAGRAVPSVAESRRLHELEQTSQDNEARVLYERGRTAEEGGKPQVAKIYYQMAAKQATGELKALIQARLDALSSSNTP